MSGPPRKLTNSRVCVRSPTRCGRPRRGSRPRRAPRAPTGTSRSFDPLPRASTHVVLRSTCGHVEVDRLRRAQPARVHQLQQRAVAQRDRVGALRLLEQPLHLRAARARAAASGSARRRELRGRVGVAYPLAAQVTVEGAQRRGLSLDRRGGRRRPPVAPRQRGQEVGHVAPARRSPRPARALPGRRRTGAGPNGRTGACCAPVPARARGRRGSRGPAPRIAPQPPRPPSSSMTISGARAGLLGAQAVLPLGITTTSARALARFRLSRRAHPAPACRRRRASGRKSARSPRCVHVSWTSGSPECRVALPTAAAPVPVCGRCARRSPPNACREGGFRS